MPILPPPSRSGSSAASSPVVGRGDKLGKTGSKRLARVSSWSTWLSGSAFRGSDNQGCSIPANLDGRNDSAASADDDETETKKKGSLRRPGQSDENKKFVTIEEPRGEAADDAKSDLHSDAGTIRRPATSDRDTAPQSPTLRDGHQIMSRGHQPIRDTPHDALNGRHDDHTFLERPRRTSQTVSRDDFLTARGANPRTGLISPSLTDESHSEDLGPQVEGPGGPMNNQKWRLKGDQWVSLDASERTPLPTPPTDGGAPLPLSLNSRDQAEAHVSHMIEAGVPLENIEDRFVVSMPSAREPCPPTMTPEQIVDFQQACNRFYRHRNNMVNPAMPPSPRSMSPGGPSTPPRKLLKSQGPGPMDRGRRPLRPAGLPGAYPGDGPMQWRHSSAPPENRRDRRDWGEQRSFLEDGRIYGKGERGRPMPDPRSMNHQGRTRRYPPGHPLGTPPFRPPSQCDPRSPRDPRYAERRYPNMPRYPQEISPRYGKREPIEDESLESIERKGSIPGDIPPDPHCQASRSHQKGPSTGLVATITTTTTTSTVTPIHLGTVETENHLAPRDRVRRNSSFGESLMSSARSSFSTPRVITKSESITNMGSLEFPENSGDLGDLEHTGNGIHPVAVHTVTSGEIALGVDGPTRILGIQDGETKNIDGISTDWMMVQLTFLSQKASHLVQTVVLYAILIAMASYRYMIANMPAELKTREALNSMKVMGGVLFVAITLSLILSS